MMFRNLGLPFLSMVSAAATLCHSVFALELGDRIQFFDQTSRAMVIGTVSEFSKLPTGKSVAFVKVENTNRIVEAPKGQYLILESPSAHGWIPNAIPEKTVSFELPKSLLHQKYFCSGQTCSSPFGTALDLLTEENSFWSRYDRVIFLAEGGDSAWEGTRWHIPFASALHQVFPRIQITKTDLDKVEKYSEDGKVIELPVNHTHSFSRTVIGTREKADAVIMLRGLCHCGIINGNSSFTCGGLFTTREKELRKFLIQAVGLVNWQNPDSFAYLEGQHYSRPFEDINSGYKENPKYFKRRILTQSIALAQWHKAASKVAQMYGLNFHFEYLKNGEFKAIVFRPSESMY